MPKKAITTHFEKDKLYEKYTNLPRHIDRLEPTSVAHIFKEYKGPMTFYPHIGIFFHEFALGYCYNLHSK